MGKPSMKERGYRGPFRKICQSVRGRAKGRDAKEGLFPSVPVSGNHRDGPAEVGPTVPESGTAVSFVPGSDGNLRVRPSSVAQIFRDSGSEYSRCQFPDRRGPGKPRIAIPSRSRSFSHSVVTESSTVRRVTRMVRPANWEPLLTAVPRPPVYSISF